MAVHLLRARLWAPERSLIQPLPMGTRIGQPQDTVPSGVVGPGWQRVHEERRRAEAPGEASLAVAPCRWTLCPAGSS